MNEIDQILDEYVTIHNKKFEVYFRNYIFNLEFDNEFTIYIETGYRSNHDVKNAKAILSYYIEYFKSRGHQDYNINQLTIKTSSDRCNMTYKYYMNQPMPAIELKLNINIAKNPQLINSLDCKEYPEPLFKKYSHIPFNN